MKQLVRAIFDGLILASACSTGESPATSDPAAPPGWELVWADEFDGDVIDQSNWSSVVMPDPFNEELQYYTDRIDDQPGANAWVEDGSLIIFEEQFCERVLNISPEGYPNLKRCPVYPGGATHDEFG